MQKRLFVHVAWGPARIPALAFCLWHLMTAFGLHESQLLEAGLGAARLVCTGLNEWDLEVHGKGKVS